jgi:LAS superfamily LD-carboxypeptidase LdcB
MSNHLRNIRALFENAKSFKVSRKVDTYEYESLEKMILDDNVRYSEVIELFTDKDYREWFYERNFKGKEFNITRYSET